MGFLVWFYSEGINYYLRLWQYNLSWLVHFFSPGILLKTLLSPWRRMSAGSGTQFNIERFFSDLIFNSISRGIGFVVRVTLLLSFVVIAAMMIALWSIGFFVWLVIPFFGIPSYLKYKKHPSFYTQKLLSKLEVHPGSPEKYIFGGEAGEFVLKHLGNIDQHFFAGTSFQMLPGQQLGSFTEVVGEYLRQNPPVVEKLSRAGIVPQDIINAALVWEEEQIKISDLYEGHVFASPGLGLELIFGYTPTLNSFVSDMSAKMDFTHHLIGREETVGRIERVLTAGKSVCLTGEAGVGKKTVVLEFAKRASLGEWGRELSYKRILELDYNAILGGSADLNLKKTTLKDLLNEAADAGNVILVLKDLHRLVNSAVEGIDFTDVFEEVLVGGNLKIIAISTPREYEQFIARQGRINKFFQRVDVKSPNLEEAMQILIRQAVNTETKNKDLLITFPALRQILAGSDKYITDTPFPEKALELLDDVVVLNKKNNIKVIGAPEVNSILSEKTGVPFTTLNQEEKHKLGNIESLIHKRVVNQEIPISLIGKALRARTLGVKSESRPVGSFLFLGPTGVGKTQTAKVLAGVYFGSEKEILRFDMSEYSGAEGLGRLIGSTSQNMPGVLTTAIKNKPASLLLLDEIEKAPREVLNLFLALLDEGRITDAHGTIINCKHLFVIATSNAAAEYIRNLVKEGASKEDLQKKVVEYVQKENLFSPEFLNRFDGVVVFETLSQENLVKVAKMQLTELADNLKSKNIHLEVTDDVAKKVAEDGYQPEFGARPMRRVVELAIGDVLGRAILLGQINPGDKIKLTAGQAKEEYSWEKI